MKAFLTEEQLLLQDSLSRLVSDRYDFQRRQHFAQSERGWSQQMWSSYAEMGLLGACLPEAVGGYGGGGIDLMLIMESFGRASVLEPFLPSIVLAATALIETAPPTLLEELMPKVIDGSMWLSFAHGEAAGRHDAAFVETSAVQSGDDWILNGAKTLVLHGDSASAFVVTARTTGGVDSEAGLSLFLVPADAPGLEKTALRLHDSTRAAELVLSGVKATLLGQAGGAWPVIRKVFERGMAATIAESVGAMDACVSLTVEYLKTRKQFGSTIGSYQALQHRASEMLIALEQAKSMALLAAIAHDENDADIRARELSRAKILVGRNGRFIAQQAIQLHGGIGMTEEAALGHHVRRLMVTEQLFGDPQSHLTRLSNEILNFEVI